MTWPDFQEFDTFAQVAERMGAASRAWGTVSALHTTQPVQAAPRGGPRRAASPCRKRREISRDQRQARRAERATAARPPRRKASRSTEWSRRFVSGRSSVLVVRGRARGGEVGSAGLRRGPRDRVPGRAGGRSRVGDGAAAGRAAAAGGRVDARAGRASPAAATGGAAAGVRVVRGTAPDRFLLGLAALSLLSDAADGGRSCAWSTTCSGSTGSPPRSCRSSRVASRPSRSGWCSRFASRATCRSSTGCRSSWSKDSATRTRARCSRRGSQGVSTSRFATGSWPRPAAIRSRSSSCRAD